MRPYIYLIIFAIVLIMAKAFYFDSFLEERASEANASIEENQGSTPLVTQSESNTSTHTHKKQNSANEGMPVDQLGDNIAEKLEGKF